MKDPPPYNATQNHPLQHNPVQQPSFYPGYPQQPHENSPTPVPHPLQPQTGNRPQMKSKHMHGGKYASVNQAEHSVQHQEVCNVPDNNNATRAVVLMENPPPHNAAQNHPLQYYPSQQAYFYPGYTQPPHGNPPPPMVYLFHPQTRNPGATGVFVQQPAQVQTRTRVIPHLNDQMGISIVATFCCLWPIGLFALLKSYEARKLYLAGDHGEAKKCARTAKRIAYSSIIGGFILVVVIIFYEISSY